MTMKFVFYTNSVSAHQLPLARELVARLGVDEYRYVYTGDLLQGGGQEVEAHEPWIVRYPPHDHLVSAESRESARAADELLFFCRTLLSGIRDLDLFENRATHGLQTFYTSERWFKPLRLFDLRLFDCLISVRAPGWMRMLVPSYRRMAKRFVKWLKTDPHARYLAVGPWAKADMLWLGVPEEKIVDWGYFVAPSDTPPSTNHQAPGTVRAKRVLWVGRMLDWKHVDTIIKAVAWANKVKSEEGRGKGCGEEDPSFTLTLVGDGPEKGRLEHLARSLSAPIKQTNTQAPASQSPIKQSNNQTIKQWFTFLPPVPIDQVREVMRAHDVYVLASDEQEGWGAALNDAMEEGMLCLGTSEAGASAALLPESHVFHAGDWKTLASLLTTRKQVISMSTASTPRRAVEKLMGLMEGR